MPEALQEEQPDTRLFLSPPLSVLARFTNDDYARLEANLSPSEKDRRPDRKSDKRYLEYLISRCLLRQALSITLPPFLPPAAWQISYRSNSPPVLESPEAQAWHCSLSHSNGRIAIALSNEGPCGVDIERHRPRRNLRTIAEHYFSTEEFALIRSTLAPANAIIFYRLWALKEAWFKSNSGQPLSDILKGMDFSTPETRTAPQSTGRRAWWQEADGYSLAYVGAVKPRKLVQLIPGEPEIELPNELSEYQARPQPISQ